MDDENKPRQIKVVLLILLVVLLIYALTVDK